MYLTEIRFVDSAFFVIVYLAANFEVHTVTDKNVKMQLLYCGWNGFNQVANHTELFLTSLTQVQTEKPVTAVSCSWSALCIVSGSRLYISGFIDGAINISKSLSLENGENLHEVVNNSKHIIVISESKKLWRRLVKLEEGSSKFSLISLGELNNDDDDDASKEFVKKVSCSNNICVALTNAGNFYAIPSRINEPGLVVTDVACGNEHTVFVTAAGSVYTFGQGSRGQLGHGELEAEEEPREVHALAGVRMRHVSSGGWHCAVISEEGDLYTWGWNRFGQLGVTEEPEEERKPKRMRLDSLLKKVAVDTFSTSPTDEMKSEESAGDDGSGGVYAFPQLVGWTEKVVKTVSCGARHTVALLEDGTLWGCGWNAYGQLGVSPDTCHQMACMTPIPMTLPTQGKIKSVVCGEWSTCVLVS